MRTYLYHAALTLSIVAMALPAGMQAQGLHLTPGARLVVSGAPNLVLNNAGLTNNGQIIADSSTVIFTGNSTPNASFVGGSNSVTFYNLTINRSSGDAWLNNNTAITGHITMQGGNLRLNNYMLDLGETGSIQGETSSSCITGAAGGVIRARALLNAPRAVNPGNIGVAITSEGNLGWTTLTRGHIQQAAGLGSGIQRYFDINPESNTGQSTSLRFYYLDGELEGKSGDELAVFSKDNGGAGWTPRGKDQSDRIAGWVTKENIGELHRFTLAIPEKQMNRTVGRLQEGGSVQVSPNPSPGVFRMILTSDREKDRVIRLYDVAGHLLESKKWHCTEGTNVIEWNVAGLSQGTYHLAADGVAPVTVEIIK